MKARSLKLPEVLDRVTVERLVSPSRLSLDPVCVLALQGRDDNGRTIPGLIESPWAIVGVLVHSAIQLADGCTNIGDVFDELVRRREDELSADPRRAHFVPLRRAIGEGDWLDRRHLVELRAGSDRAFPMEQLAAPRQGQRRRMNGPHEYRLESEALGLVGRADLVEVLADNVVRITDWKTGSLFGDQGEVKPAFRLQMAAYRMLAREQWPGREIQLVLWSGEAVVVEPGPDDEAAVRGAVNRVQDVIRGRSEAPAHELARMGVACRYCPIRHRCPAFMEVLRATGHGALPEGKGWTGDVLGTVTDVGHWEEMTLVNLLTQPGRRVQLRCSDGRLVDGLSSGETIAAFGFDARFRRNKQTGRVSEPVTFTDREQSRNASQAEVFVVPND